MVVKVNGEKSSRRKVQIAGSGFTLSVFASAEMEGLIAEAL